MNAALYSGLSQIATSLAAYGCVDNGDISAMQRQAESIRDSCSSDGILKWPRARTRTGRRRSPDPLSSKGGSGRVANPKIWQGGDEPRPALRKSPDRIAGNGAPKANKKPSNSIGEKPNGNFVKRLEAIGATLEKYSSTQKESGESESSTQGPIHDLYDLLFCFADTGRSLNRYLNHLSVKGDEANGLIKALRERWESAHEDADFMEAAKNMLEQLAQKLLKPILEGLSSLSQATTEEPA